MKGKYIIVLVISAFIIGAVSSGYFAFQKLRVNKYSWGTYMSKEFRFSIEYPKNLIPLEYSPQATVSFYPWSATDGFQSQVIITVGTVWIDAKDKTPGLKELDFSVEGNRTNATIYFGKRLYSFLSSNLNREDAERMVKSIKFTE